MVIQSNRRSFLAGTAAAAIGMPFVSRTARAELKPFKLAWIRQFAPAGLVQKEVELAQAAGLKVELIGFNRGLDGMLALQKGDAIGADCLVGYSQLFLAMTQGIDLTAVSGSALGLTAILISPAAAAKSEVDDKNKAVVAKEPWTLLRGKNVGGARGSQQEFMLRSYMTAHGMDFEKDIKFIDLKTNADQALALKQGSIDAAVVVEPTATQARIEGYGLLLSHGYDAGEFVRLNSSLLVRTDAIAQYPQEIQAMVDAHVKAVRFYQENRTAWVADTAKVTLFDKAVLTHLLNPQELGLEPKYWNNVEFDVRLPVKPLQMMARNLYEAKYVPKDVSGEIEAHVNFSFLEKATGKSRAELGG